MEPLIVVVIVVALFIATALGWYLGQRGSHLVTEITAQLRSTLNAVEQERDEARDKLVRVETSLSERERSFQDQLKAVLEAKEQMAASFSELGQAALEKAQSAFLQRADDRFKESETLSGERLSALLNPVHERLAKYENAVEKVEAERREAYGQLSGVIGEMRLGQERVREETSRLVSSLRNAPKARGRWGEQQLRNVLESCGLAEHVDFLMEVSVDTDEGRLRPDCIIRIPGGKTLLVDAKVSFNDYQDAFDATDDVARELALKRHHASMKNHVNMLGNKAYQTQFGEAPDYVIMFVGGEHFLSAALEYEPSFWDFAFSKKVLIATPTNLVAIARTVASVWQQEDLAVNAREIAELGKEMHERLAKAGEDLKKVGKGLTSAVNAYNGFANSFEGRLMVTGRKFEKLNIETGKRDLEIVEQVEVLPRYGNSDSQLLGDQRDAAE